MKIVKSKHRGLVHQRASCLECDWMNEEYIDCEARKEAKKHVLRTGHRVQLESGIMRQYYLINS